MRNILFVAYDLMSRTASVRDDRASVGVRLDSERYVEQRTVLASFGKLISERTSGVHRRIYTPPDGIRPSHEDERAQERAEAQRTERTIIGKIPQADCVVAVADSGIDGMLKLTIITAITMSVPVLILKSEKPQVLIESSDFFKGHAGVTYLTHGDLSRPRGMHDFRSKIARYIAALPQRAQQIAG
jgi:hypothetical protein